MADGIDAKLLKGLTFKGAEVKTITDDQGKEKEKSVAFERKLTPDDVLKWEDMGDQVKIITADGRKYFVDKKAKPGE
jgi:hypothetical protein